MHLFSGYGISYVHAAERDNSQINIKMNHLLPLIVCLSLHSLAVSSCETSCCNEPIDCCKDSTKDCSSSTECCQATNCCHTTTNLCQTTSNCCQKTSRCYTTCSVGCRTTTCMDQCRQNCVKNECDENKNEKVSDTVSKETVVEKTTSTTNDNKFHMSATIGINNTINNENRIHIPVNVTNGNSQSIIINTLSNPAQSNPTPTLRPWPTPATTTPSGPLHAEKVPILVPVPSKPILIPVPYPVIYPSFQPRPGCCMVVNPCSFHGCQSNEVTCGFECSHTFMYRPVNPCEGQCNKRPFAFNRFCQESGHCYNNFVNCSMCDENFYQSYSSYQQCGGCYYR